MKFKGHCIGDGIYDTLYSFDFENEVAKCSLKITPKINDERLNEFVYDKNNVFQLEIKRYREKRSNDANSYMWVLCDEIAKKIGGNVTKEEIYRKAVREVGVFEVLPLKKEAIPRFIQTWSKNGVGWLCESLGKSKLPGYVNLVCYYGSSTYDTKEMSRLIDYIVEEAKNLGIETMPKDELDALKKSWEV